MRISWTPPAPRRGWSGAWDRFIGPGATTAELALQLGGAAILGAAFLTFALLHGVAAWPALHIALLAVLIVDLCGGVLTNATSSAKRWYHRQGQRARQQLVFVAPHGAHLALLVWLSPGLGWQFAIAAYAYLLAATCAVLAVPLYLQRPLGLAVFAGGLLVNDVLAPPLELAWFVPLLYLKLLVSHLLTEAPFRPEHERRVP